jgi:multiple sugar transport system permease protein
MTEGGWTPTSVLSIASRKSASGKRRRGDKRTGMVDREAIRARWLLIAPAVVVLLALNIFPTLYALDVSLYYWRLAGLQPRRFIGINNYLLLVGDDRFLNSILVSAEFVVLAVSLEFLLGLGLAFVFNARLPGLATLRKLSLLPVMLMPLVAGLAWFYMFNENFGVVNWFVWLLTGHRAPFLTDPYLALGALVVADAWQWTPFVMLVLFAALQSLPEYVYEAACMDGLSEWQIFWRVTLPLLRPVILIVVVIRIVDALRMIELVFMMTKGGPGGYTEVVPWYLYVTGFTSLNLGYAAAMAVMMIVMVSILSQFLVRRLAAAEA